MAKAPEWAERLKEAAPDAAQLKVWCAVFVGLLLPVLYQVIVFRGSEEFRVKALTLTLPPAIWHMAASFFPLLLLGAWGWRARWSRETRRWLLVYALCVLAFVYAPMGVISFARKMIEGFQIPLLVFAGAGLARLPYRRVVAPLVLLVCAVSPLAFWDWTLRNAEENNGDRVQRFLMPAYYLSNADAGALLRLQNAPKRGAVLCLPLLGSYVPRATGLFTFTGHWAETLHLRRKLGELRAFYGGRMSPTQARAFLQSNRIDYVIESPYERQFAPGPGQSTARNLGLKPIYSADSPDGPTVVYEVD